MDGEKKWFEVHELGTGFAPSDGDLVWLGYLGLKSIEPLPQRLRKLHSEWRYEDEHGDDYPLTCCVVAHAQPPELVFSQYAL